MTGRIQKGIKLVLALYLAVLFCVPALAAKEPLFRLDMDSLNFQKGVSGNFVISLVNAQGARIANIEGLEQFDVLSQNQSTSTSIINGDATYQEDLYFTVMPRTAGQFTLKANIEYNGQSYETNAMQVTVSEGSANEGEPAQDLFIKTILSHSEAYLGEKVVLAYELYSRYNIVDFGFTDSIAVEGAVVKDMPEDQLRGEYVYLDGNRYVKYETRQMILDPIKSGTYTIPSFNFQVNVATSAGGGFFSSSKPVYLQTEEKGLTVKPLPSEGKPKDFSGIVGELRLDGRYTREEMNYGDSFTLQAAASGSCNLDGMQKIISGEPPEFTVYETLKNTVETVQDNRYHVQKSFDVIFVPEKTGDLDVAPVSISYFNPVTEKYEKAEIPGVTVRVLGDMPLLANDEGSGQAAIETVKIEQVNYADANVGYFTIQMKKQAVYAVLTGLAIMLVLTAVMFWLISYRKKQDPVLKTLYRQLMGSQDINEIYNLFNAMIKHCCKLSLKASSQNIVLGSLPDASLAAQVAGIMDYMESNEEKGHVYLKDKIKGIYHIYLKQ